MRAALLVLAAVVLFLICVDREPAVITSIRDAAAQFDGDMRKVNAVFGHYGATTEDAGEAMYRLAAAMKAIDDDGKGTD